MVMKLSISIFISLNFALVFRLKINDCNVGCDDIIILYVMLCVCIFNSLVLFILVLLPQKCESDVSTCIVICGLFVWSKFCYSHGS